MCKPINAVCALDKIYNIVEPVEEQGGNGTNEEDDSDYWEQTYTIEVLMEIIPLQDGAPTSTPALPAKLVNYGNAIPDPLHALESNLLVASSNPISILPLTNLSPHFGKKCFKKQ